MYENRTIGQTAGELNTDLKAGLAKIDAVRALEKMGYNELADEKKKSVFTMLAEQLNEPLIYVLFVAAAASLFLKEISDAVIILTVIAMNAVVGSDSGRKGTTCSGSSEKTVQPSCPGAAGRTA